METKENPLFPQESPDVLPVEPTPPMRAEKVDADRRAAELREWDRIRQEGLAKAQEEEAAAAAWAERYAMTSELSKAATQNLVVKFAWGLFAGATVMVFYRLVRS